MKIARLLPLAAGLLLSGTATAGNVPAKEQWVLAVAKATGAGGEQFVSSLRIRNPNAQAATVALTYLPQSPFDGTGTATGNNSAATPVSVNVPAGQTVAIEDVVQTVFGNAAPSGAILVRSGDVPVTVLARTFVANARNAAGTPGTYGLTMPAQVSDEAIGATDTGYLTYVSASPTLSSGFRSNLILLNTATSTSVVNVKLLKGDGTSVGEKDYTLAARATGQITNVASAFGYSDSDTNLTAQITVKSGGPVVTGMTIVDNAISSLNYTPPSKLWIAETATFGVILDDHGRGFSGRLDVRGGKPELFTAGIVVEGCPTGTGTATEPLLFFMQAADLSDWKNTTFTKASGSSYTFAGSAPSPLDASWSGTITLRTDGTVSGTITYTRASGSGVDCAGKSASLPFSSGTPMPLQP